MNQSLEFKDFIQSIDSRHMIEWDREFPLEMTYPLLLVAESANLNVVEKYNRNV